MEIVTQNKNVMNLELEQPLLEVVQKAMAFAVFVITFELKDNFTTNLQLRANNKPLICLHMK